MAGTPLAGWAMARCGHKLQLRCLLAVQKAERVLLSNELQAMQAERCEGCILAIPRNEVPWVLA